MWKAHSSAPSRTVVGPRVSAEASQGCLTSPIFGSNINRATLRQRPLRTGDDFGIWETLTPSPGLRSERLPRGHWNSAGLALVISD